jgi:putative intracellular protease/amidase
MHPRILIALTSHAEKGNTGEKTGAYLPEVAHPWAVFTKAGFEVDFASVRGGEVPLDGTAETDSAVAAFLESAAYRRLHESTASREVDGSRYDAIFFAGGHGTMWDFPDDPGFGRVARAVWEKGGVVAAVCHGPAALVNLRLSNGDYLVHGRDVSAFTNEEERAVKLDRVVPFSLQDALEGRGARVIPAPKWQRQVVVSGRLVTGQNPASAAAVADAVVSTLARTPRI